MMGAVPFPEIDTVFLDAGGTIVDIDADAVSAQLRTLGVLRPPEAVARAEAEAKASLFWESRDDFPEEEKPRIYAQAVIDGLDVEVGSREEVIEAMAAWLADPVTILALWKKVPEGVAEGLARLREEGLKLVVVSNSDGQCEKRLVEVGLRPLLDGVVDSTLTGAAKPDPRIFRHALETYRADPAYTLHIGDIFPIDVEGAWAAGLHAAMIDPFDCWEGKPCPRFRRFGEICDALVG